MPRLAFLVVMLAMLAATGAEAQGWREFLSREDRFVHTFPGEPAIAEGEWIGENGVSRFARRYSAERAGNFFVLTVVDYEDADYNLRRGSFAHAATVYRAKGVVTYDAWAAIDRVDGQQLQITLGNGRRLFFAAHFNMGRLYILEVDNGPRAAAPIQFLQGMIFLDENGARVRYSETGARMERTDDLPEALGGPDLDGPILEGGSDEYIP